MGHYAEWRVVYRGGYFYLQFLAGVSYPPIVTKETRTNRDTARSHWHWARKQTNAYAMNGRRWKELP